MHATTRTGPVTKRGGDRNDEQKEQEDKKNEVEWKQKEADKLRKRHIVCLDLSKGMCKHSKKL